MNTSTLQIQKTILAPLMQQSIAVLMLPLIELNAAIEQELQNNPLLEVDPEAEKNSEAQLKENIEKLRSLSNVTVPLDPVGADEDAPEELPLAAHRSLEDHLLEQLRIETSDPEKLKIGELVIGNIDEDGYLKATVEEIAELAGTKDFEMVENILQVIQNFEPVGIASRNVTECLSTQVHYKKSPFRKLAEQIILEHLEDLGAKRYQQIARKCKASLEEVKQAADLIATLDPRPARHFRPLAGNIYIQPDVYLVKDPDSEDLRIEVNRHGVPELRINNSYSNLLNAKNITAQEREYIKERVNNAMNFIKSIRQRGKTIMDITKYIVDHQKDFFEGGESILVPMRLKDVAEALERSESTISRAINNKYIQTPQGLFPMKFFFSQAIFEGEKKDISTHNIKEEMQRLIEDENKSSPLSDQELQDHFEKQGLKLARRTISKYRQMLNIPPSHLRKA